MAAGWWEESTLQNSLLSFLSRDRNFLKNFGTRLTKADFKSNRGEGNSREIVAGIALNYWRQYHEPVGGLLKSEVLDYIESHKIDERSKKRFTYNKKELLEILEFITAGDKLVPAVAMEDKVSKYLENKMIKDSLDQVLTMQEEGTLTKRKFGDICRSVNDFTSKHRLESKDFLTKTSLEDRIVRRTKDSSESRPFLMIDFIDKKTRAIGRGDLGIFVGPLKMGKSLALAHTAVAYAKQRLKVLYFTLEDPTDEVEDRFDAALTGIDIDKLRLLPNKLRRRFKKFATVLNSRIHLVDGTAESVSIGDMEEVYLRERDHGFTADAVIVDYDDYVRPVGKYQKKAEAFNEIYVDYRRFLAKYQLYGWTAAQAQRMKEDVQVITANKTADDIGKIRKATMAIGIGQGKRHVNARYLYLMAHKRGRQHFGGEIMTGFSQGLFYDRERTLAMPELSKEKSKEV
jgi:hypothetical protein